MLSCEKTKMEFSSSRHCDSSINLLNEPSFEMFKLMNSQLAYDLSQSIPQVRLWIASPHGATRRPVTMSPLRAAHMQLLEHQLIVQHELPAC